MLTEMVMADATFRIDEIGGWPIFVTERLPDRVPIVDNDRIVDFQTSDGLAHIAGIPFEREFSRRQDGNGKRFIFDPRIHGKTHNAFSSIRTSIRTLLPRALSPSFRPPAG